MKARWQGWTYLRYVDNEACNNVKSCKMTMMPPFRLAKIVNEDEQHGRAHHQPSTLLCKIKMKEVAKQAQEKEMQYDKKGKE